MYFLSFLSMAFAMDMDTTLRNCRNVSECSSLIAQSIVSGSQKCWADSYHQQTSDQAAFKNCVSDFCYKKCGEQKQCTDLCAKKGHGIYHQVNAFMQVKIDSAVDDPDELMDLKAENPSAYAIVKALLTKRALGLLNPDHPSASMAATRSSSSGKKDWLNWKPANDSGIVEEEAAKQTADEAPAPVQQTSDFLASQRSQETPIAPAALEKAPIEAATKTNVAAPMSNESASVKDAPIKKKLSSLGSWGSIFSSDSPHQSGQKTENTETNPYLASVNWGERESSIPDHENPYLSSFSSDTSSHKEALVTKQAAFTNPYLMDLQ